MMNGLRMEDGTDTTCQWREKVWVGTAGWSYPDWAGIVYPPGAAAKRPLHYLAPYLDCVEVNTSFYRIPDSRLVGGWLRDVAAVPHFQFLVKLWRGWTHGEGPDSSPAGEGQVPTFRNAVAPLADAGRLAGVLAQFPWSFRRSPENRERLARVCDWLGGLPLFVELRHRSWLAEPVQAELARRGVGWCNIDQPPHAGGVPLMALRTVSDAYFRFHGRNCEAWFAADATRDTRYDYLYSRQEVEELLNSVTRAAAEAGRTFVIYNNHWRGQEVANAVETRGLLRGEAVPAPPGLWREYPQIQDVSVSRPGEAPA